MHLVVKTSVYKPFTTEKGGEASLNDTEIRKDVGHFYRQIETNWVTKGQSGVVSRECLDTSPREPSSVKTSTLT